MLAVKIVEKLQTSAKVQKHCFKNYHGKSVRTRLERIKLVTGGKPLQVSIGPRKYKPRQITLVDMIRIQVKFT